MTATTQEKVKPATPEEFTARAVEHDRNRESLLADLSVLEDQAGAVMLDDPDAVEALTGRVASLRARADLEGRAAAEARRRAQAARVAGLRGEADALEPEVARIRKDLAAYQSKRDKLLKELETFTRAEWVLKPDPELWQVGGSYSRPARPDEMLLKELREVEEQQTSLRSQAEAVEADPDWVSASERWLVHVTECWDEALTGHRKAAQDLAAARVEIVETAAIVKHDLDSATYVPEWLSKLQARVVELEQHLQGFHEDVTHFRGQGLALADGEVADLMAELGLEVPAGSAGGRE